MEKIKGACSWLIDTPNKPQCATVWLGWIRCALRADCGLLKRTLMATEKQLLDYRIECNLHQPPQRSAIVQYSSGGFNDSRSSFDDFIMHLHSFTTFTSVLDNLKCKRSMFLSSPDKKWFKETVWFKIPVSASLFPGSVSSSLALICSASDPLPRDQMTTEW